MSKHQDGRGPRFLRFFAALLEALKKLGGSGMPEDVKNLVIEDMAISEEELLETLDSGQGRVSNGIDWARFYLAKAGYLDGSKRGTWSLTTQGQVANLTKAAALELFHKVHRKYQAARKRTKAKSSMVEKGPRRKMEIHPMPRKVARRLMVRCAKGEKIMVVVAKKGKPTSIYGLEEYLKKRQLQFQTTDRKAETRPSDALPRVKAGVIMPLKREYYYD